ncbi:hypothetical protein RFI_18387 [Reticulomyxa filosa]|uniref:Uncharacterized protein n=1 Tax=Reticulomyxa filosa TaxID=46433 RepID=X6MZ30_RETFI|nr:hypothetical protein RFI_18387 [Reticulomyxa filosa]|eukprot:ETO18863.1 hypothetical protein RFI_18387 [Reticulomyxa filosa]
MSFKAYLNEEAKAHKIILTELTIESLRREIIQVTKLVHADDVLTTITNKNGRNVETDRDVVDVFKDDPAVFTVQFQQSFFLLKKLFFFEEITATLQSKITSTYKIKCPLVLLTGAIKHEQYPNLENVKQDLILLKTLFEQRFGYQVFSTYDPQISTTESLTADELSKLILTYCLDLEDATEHNDKKTAYDGLIFVWRGYGICGTSENTLITSDNSIKHFKDIQDIFIKQMQYFVEKPKIFIIIANKIQDKTNQIAGYQEYDNTKNDIWYNQDGDLFTLFVTTSAKLKIESRDYFVEAFCQIAESNVNQGLDFIMKQLIKLVGNPVSDGDAVRPISNIRSDIFLSVRSSNYQMQNYDCDNDEDEIKHDISTSMDNKIPEILDFKYHWNKNWRQANAEAVKIVEHMIHANEQGLIIVACNASEWKHMDNNSSLFISLINKEEMKKEIFGDYCLYVVKKELIIVDEVKIDGNVYAIDCEIQWKGNVNITAQLFVTKKVTMNQQLKQSISSIQWNTKIHHDIPVRLYGLEYKEEQCLEKKCFDDAIVHLQEHLQLSTNAFGLNNPYAAIAYNKIGCAYDDKGDYDKAIEFYEKALKVIFEMFGYNYNIVAQLYYNLGITYKNKKNYDKAMECYKKSLDIRTSIFGSKNSQIADSYSSLGNIFFKQQQNEKAIEHYNKSLEIRLNIFGFNHSDVAWLYYKLGKVYSREGQDDKAIDCYNNSLQIRIHLFGTNNNDVINSYHSLGYVYVSIGECKQAIDCYEKELKIKREIFGNKSKEVGDSCRHLGNIFKVIGKKKIAYKYFKESWMVYSIALGEWNKITMNAKKKD